MSAALAVVLSLSVFVFVSGWFGGGRGDVVPDVVKDTETHPLTVTQGQLRVVAC